MGNVNNNFFYKKHREPQNATLPYPANEIVAGLSAPIEAVAFLWRRKGLFVTALFSHLFIFGGYIWAVTLLVIPKLLLLLNPFLGAFQGSQIPISVFETLVMVAIYVLSAILYSIIGVPIANLILSPLFDIITTRAYQSIANVELRDIEWSSFAKSFLLEIIKFAFLAGLFVATILSTLMLFLSPLVFLFAVWFYGWQEMDRTLCLTGFHWRKRLWFGVKHFPACASLGLWFYLPILGSLLSFVMAAAGGILVARVQSEKDKLDIQSFNSKSAGPRYDAFDERR